MTEPRGSILALNAGSSSLKFALFNTALVPLLRGEIEDIATVPVLRAVDATGLALPDHRWAEGTVPFATVLGTLLDYVHVHSDGHRLDCAGHRIVHGGAEHVMPVRITDRLLCKLDALTPLDPLHMPHCLAPVRALALARPDLPQVACFDTAFHHTMPMLAQTVPVSQGVRDLGVRRYGFHGLSYEYVAAQLAIEAPELARRRVIVAHLGAGASLCALHGGASVATTMGFSTLDGLMMATRCGTIDPGVILFLARQGRSLRDIEDLLYHHSGLLGVSGISGDMRVLLASDDPRAATAIDQFTYRIAVEAGGMISALGGIDGLVFTAGIGERSSVIRSKICARLRWLGLRIDDEANGAGATRIAAPRSRIDVRVVATDEEAMIARHTRDLIDGQDQPN